MGSILLDAHAVKRPIRPVSLGFHCSAEQRVPANLLAGQVRRAMVPREHTSVDAE